MRAGTYLAALGCAAAAAMASAQGFAPSAPANVGLRPGTWAYTSTATGGEASFIDAAGQPQLIVRCTRATRRITFSARGAQAGSMLLWTTSASRSLPATYDAATARVNADVQHTDRILDEIAFSRGRFSVTVPGLSAVVVPAWPEPARAVEDCRN